MLLPPYCHLIIATCFSFFLPLPLMGILMERGEARGFEPTAPQQERRTFEGPRASRTTARNAPIFHQKANSAAITTRASIADGLRATDHQSAAAADPQELSLAPQASDAHTEKEDISLEREKDLLKLYQTAAALYPQTSLKLIQKDSFVEIVPSDKNNRHDNEQIIDNFYQLLKDQYGEVPADIGVLGSDPSDKFHETLAITARIMTEEALRDGLTGEIINAILKRVELIKSSLDGNNFTITEKQLAVINKSRAAAKELRLKEALKNKAVKSEQTGNVPTTTAALATEELITASEQEDNGDDNLSLKPLVGDATLPMVDITEKKKNTLDLYRRAAGEYYFSDTPLKIIEKNKFVEVIPCSEANDHTTNQATADDFYNCLKNDYGEAVADLVFLDQHYFDNTLCQDGCNNLAEESIKNGLNGKIISEVFSRINAIEEAPLTGQQLLSKLYDQRERVSNSYKEYLVLHPSPVEAYEQALPAFMTQQMNTLDEKIKTITAMLDEVDKQTDSNRHGAFLDAIAMARVELAIFSRY